MIADAASVFAADELRLVGAPCTGVGAVFARRHRAWCCGRCRPSSTRAWLIGSACDVNSSRPMSSRSVGSVTIGDGLGASGRFVLSVMVRLGTITQYGAGSFGRDAASAFGVGPGLVRTSHF